MNAIAPYEKLKMPVALYDSTRPAAIEREDRAGDGAAHGQAQELLHDLTFIFRNIIRRSANADGTDRRSAGTADPSSARASAAYFFDRARVAGERHDLRCRSVPLIFSIAAQSAGDEVHGRELHLARAPCGRRLVRVVPVVDLLVEGLRVEGLAHRLQLRDQEVGLRVGDRVGQRDEACRSWRSPRCRSFSHLLDVGRVCCSCGTIWRAHVGTVEAPPRAAPSVPSRPGMYPTKLTLAPVYPPAVIAAVRPGAVWKLVSVSRMFGFAAVDRLHERREAHAGARGRDVGLVVDDLRALELV